MPEKIDYSFLKEFKNLIESEINNNNNHNNNNDNNKQEKRFVLITGGGRTARNYQKAAKNISSLDSEDVDWLGIHATRINAHLIRAIFKENAFPRIIKNPNEKISSELSNNHKVIVAAGWKPGFSTDYDAVILAKNLGAKKVINLSNIDYVYNKDPKKFSDAKKIKEISWKEFRKLIPKEWDPGLNSPFDPVASKEAEALDLKVACINGKNLEAIKNCINNLEFVGTIIKD